MSQEKSAIELLRELNQTEHQLKNDLTDREVLGYFGNIWVKSHVLRKKGDTNGANGEGHLHDFDHVTLLLKGSVLVEIVGSEPKKFEAPTFIGIRKEKSHRFTALEDNTVYFCVFALRDVDGEVVDEIIDEDNLPYNSGIAGYKQNRKPEGIDDSDLKEWLRGKTIFEFLE